MIGAPRLLARLALFSALVYVLSWGSVWIPNFSVGFFVVFAAGYLWGATAGAVVGGVGFGLFTFFNPYGPAAWPIMAAQILGGALGGPVGAVAFRAGVGTISVRRRAAALALTGVISTLLFFVPVNVVDAWLFGPFWPRFVTSMIWSLISLGGNALIFPLLFPVTTRLYPRE